MKTLAKIIVLAAGVAVAVPVTNAADAPAPDVKHPRLRALMQRRAVIRHRIAQKLNLSADQIAQLKADRAKTRTAIKAIRADSSLTPEQKKAKARETLQSARTEMRGVLTPDQQAQWDQMRKNLRARLGKN